MGSDLASPKAGSHQEEGLASDHVLGVRNVPNLVSVHFQLTLEQMMPHRVTSTICTPSRRANFIAGMKSLSDAASTPPLRLCRVKACQLLPSVLGGEAPLHRRPSFVAFLFPCPDLPPKPLGIGYATLQALPRKHRELDLHHVEP